MKNITKKYSNGKTTILWKPHICSHSGLCAGGLPEVFKPSERPWVKMENSTSERIIEQVQKCPSAALSIQQE